MIKVIKKAVSIIDIIALKGVVGFSEIQRISKLNKSTLSHILTTLNESEYVKKDSSGNYTLGNKLYQLTGKESSESILIEISQRHASELLLEINESVVMAMRHECDRLNLCKFRPNKSLQVSIGDIAQHPSGWYTTATGRILLAFASEEDRGEIISQIGLPPTSLWAEASDRKSLEFELDRIRKEQIVSLSFDGIVDAIAVPVPDASGQSLISVACVFPVASYNTISRDAFSRYLRRTARRFTKELILKGISVSKIKI